MKPPKCTRVKLVIHPLFVAVVLLAVFCGWGAIIWALLLAVLLHEMAHAWVAGRMGAPLRAITILPFGAEVAIDCAFLDTEKRVWILLAGPFANIAVAVVCGALIWLFPNLFLFLEIFIVANAIPAVLNLLPIYPFDGGKVLFLFMDKKNQKRFVFASNAVFVVLFVACCIWFFNVAVLCFCVIMVVMGCCELKKTQFVCKIAGAGKNKAGKIHEVAVTSNMTVYEIYKLVHPKYYTKFIVVDKGRVFYECDLMSQMINYCAD